MTPFETRHLFKDGESIGFVRLWMHPQDFPDSLAIGLKGAPKTQFTEQVARRLIAANFQEGSAVDFVRRVCEWGGDNRRAGKVIKYNSPETIAKQLRQAHQACLDNDPRGALDEITKLRGLAVSFGSKHLKFLDPEQHVVLDSIICASLGFTADETGYLSFRGHCSALLQMLHEQNVMYSGFSPIGWRIADVEMAIFNHIRKVQ